MHLYLWTSWKISIVYVCRRKQHTEGGHLKDRADLQRVRSEISCAKHIWLLICCPVKKTKLLCVLWTKETGLCSSVSIKWENFHLLFPVRGLSKLSLTYSARLSVRMFPQLPPLWQLRGFLWTSPYHFPELNLHCLLKTLLMYWAGSPLCCFDFVETRFRLQLVQVGLSLAIRSLLSGVLRHLGPNLWLFTLMLKLGLDWQWSTCLEARLLKWAFNRALGILAHHSSGLNNSD